MVWNQKYQILLQQGHLNPKPQEQFIMDIMEFIRKWQATHKVLLCLDTNDTTIQSNNHGLDHILEATNLINMHQYCFPHLLTPATHNCGSKTMIIV